MYFSLDACRRGFLSGCRPLICLDGCHIKTKFGGQLLTAVGVDPNNCIFPIAMAYVEVEAKDTTPDLDITAGSKPPFTAEF